MEKIGQIFSVVDVLHFLSQILLIYAFSVLLIWLNLCKSRIFGGSNKSLHGENLAELFEFMPRINEKIRGKEVSMVCDMSTGNILFRSFGHFSDHLDNFQIIGTLWRSSGHFSDYPDTFQIIWTLCRSSRYFLGQRNTLQIIRTLWLPSFADNQQMFYTIWLLLRPIGYFWDQSKIISKYSRHSAGRPAKTFQSALWSFIQLLPSFDHGLKRRQIFEGVAHTMKAHWGRLRSG